MGKYELAEQAVFNVFDSTEWKDKEITSVPSGHDGPLTAPYIRIKVIPSGQSLNAKSISGLVMIEIFTAWGEGPRPSTRIADILDEFLQYKSFPQIQLFLSACTGFEQDVDKNDLGRAIYSVPFSHFGV